ncbi:MAG TPA: 2-oxoacid:acceptor oxidoreductase family protein [Phycisphaerae bacterium]|nr:2-oxoacid:acceptor oxidoreductase family protein [Phycisphaerae bacterium]
MNIRLAGFGGQGIVMAGYVLGRAGLLDGRNALQTQSYGSESRGGASKSDVIISSEQILDLLPTALDVLVAMSQPALDTYVASLKPEGILIYDSGLAQPSDGGVRAVGVPATAVAEKTFGRDVVANVIVLGCLVGVTGVVSHEALCQAVSKSVPPKTVEMNLRALEEGIKLGLERKERLGEPGA